MENAEFNLIRPVEGLPASPQITVERQTRQGKQKQEHEQPHEESKSSPAQKPESLDISDPEILEENLHGDDPHTIDYRA